MGGLLYGAMYAGVGGTVPVGVVSFGLDNQFWNGVALPLSLASLGLGCSLLVEPRVTQVSSPGPFATNISFWLPIPDNLALAGVELFVQGGILDQSGLRSVTDGVRCVLF